MIPNYELPADTRERLRAILSRLPAAARAAYNRENIRDKNTTLLTVVQTVVYYFDGNNQQRVADLLHMPVNDMMLLLLGYLLGSGE